MAWNFRRDPICKAQVPFYASGSSDSTNIGTGTLIQKTSNHGRMLSSTAIIASTAGSTGASLHVVLGVATAATTMGSSDLGYVMPVTPYDEMVIPWSTAVASTWITSSNIGTYMYLYDTSHINGSTGATVPTFTSDVSTLMRLTGFSTQEDVVYGYIPAEVIA